MNKPLIKNKVENYREILIAEFESWGRLAVKKLVRHLKAGCTILCGKYAGCWFGPDGSAVQKRSSRLAKSQFIKVKNTSAPT